MAIMTKDQAIEQATKNINNLVGKFPSDEWVIISSNWELNLWIDEETKEHRASLYPVNRFGDINPFKAVKIL